MKKKVIIMRCSLAFILSVIVCCMSGCIDEGSEKNTSENTSIQDITTISEETYIDTTVDNNSDSRISDSAGKNTNTMTTTTIKTKNNGTIKTTEASIEKNQSVATTTKKVTDSITTKSPNNTTTISQTETTVSTTHQTETTVIPTESKVEITPEQDVNELPFVPAF